MNTVFYIDPQSYNNLSVYDASLLSHVHGFNMVYYHNVLYQCDRVKGVDYRGVFRYRRDFTALRKVLSYGWSLFRIAFDAVRLRPQVVHIQWFRLWAVDSLLVLFLRLLGAKIVHTAHNVQPHDATPADGRHYRWFYRHCDTIIVHTERSLGELRAFLNLPPDGQGCSGLPSRLCVIPHGMLPLPVDEADVAQRVAELERQYQTQGRVVFTCMGMQNYYKGCDLVCQAWASRPELHDGGRCLLFMVGEVQNADLSPLMECPGVHIVDRMVSDLDFAAFMSLSSVTLLPYRRISQSGVLFTALQLGVPVLVSDVGGLTDPLRYGAVGWSIGEPSVQSLSDAMVYFAEHPTELSNCRKNQEAFAAVRSAFSWELIGEKTSQLYRSGS